MTLSTCPRCGSFVGVGPSPIYCAVCSEADAQEVLRVSRVPNRPCADAGPLATGDDRPSHRGGAQAEATRSMAPAVSAEGLKRVLSQVIVGATSLVMGLLVISILAQFGLLEEPKDYAHGGEIQGGEWR